MKFKLEIDCDNAAFWATEGNDATFEVSRILRKLADDIEGFPAYSIDRKLSDVNGNTVGRARFTK